MPKLLRLGIAGLGAASRQILPHAAHSGVVELAAAADIRPAACEEFQKKYGRVAFPSVEALCQSDIDAVWIATPNVFHAEHTVTAAQCGKHVIVEKPTAVTLAEAQQMIAAADRHGVRLVQGHSKIYGPAIKKMREIVAAGFRLVEPLFQDRDPWLRAVAYMGVAQLRLNFGQSSELASADMRAALAGFREVGERWGIGFSLSALADMCERIAPCSGADSPC